MIMKTALRCLCLLLTLLLALPLACAEGVEKGSREDPYRLGDVCAFTAEVLKDGSPRRSASEEAYTAVPMTLRLDNYLTPAYFAGNYRQLYKFDGTEAGAQITLTNGGDAAIVPQNAFWLTLETADGAQATGFQLMDAALGGNYGVSLQPGEEKTLYKRFEQTPEAQAAYLVLTWCEGGGRESRYFLLEERAIYPELKDGSRGDDVVALQTRLIELGYLDDDADGIFGPNTEGAVRAARVAAGLAESGVADDEMQFLLFREDFPAAPQE
mgnify:FL=1